MILHMNIIKEVLKSLSLNPAIIPKMVVMP